MRLNPDCVRDILLLVEKNTNFKAKFRYDNSRHYEEMEPYTLNEFFYHVKQCELAGLIYGVKCFTMNGLEIKDLTPDGHQFLANIRSDNNWNKTKEIAKNVGSSSLDAIKQISIGVVSELIKSQLQT